MSDYNWNEFRSLDEPLEEDLRMTLFKTVSCDDEDDYIFVDNVDSKHSLKLKEDYS